MIAHGTLLMVLKPGAILGAAEADVKRYEWNTSGENPQHYAFDRRHVRKAMRNGYGKGFDIIVEALRDRERGRASGKAMTRELYRDEALLRAAIGESDGSVMHPVRGGHITRAEGVEFCSDRCRKRRVSNVDPQIMRTKRNGLPRDIYGLNSALLPGHRYQTIPSTPCRSPTGTRKRGVVLGGVRGAEPETAPMIRVYITGPARDGLYPYRVEGHDAYGGTPIMGRYSHEPLLDACRVLASLREPDDHLVGLFHEGNPTWLMRTSVGYGSRHHGQGTPEQQGCAIRGA